MYPESLSKHFVRHLYAKGNLSKQEFIDYAVKKGYGLSCAEALYKDDYMIDMGMGFILMWLMYGGTDGQNVGKGGIIEPALDDMDFEAVTIFKKWEKSVAEDNWDIMSEEEWEMFAKVVKWRFAPGWRNKYKTITHLGYVCL